MGTEVLRPQDCLIERFREPPQAAVFYRRKTGYAYRKPVVKAEKKKLNNRSQPEPRSLPAGKVTPADVGIVTGQVTILRRGESLDSLNPKIRKESKSEKPLTVYGTGRLGPEQPGMLPKQIRVGRSPADVYAGSAFSNSPSPRSLPLPSFFNSSSKKQVELKPFDDSATRDLRRLLRLE